eukprot:COSAG02_NODE_791_length_17158_cov_12.377396_17_plen_105_part_00
MALVRCPLILHDCMSDEGIDLLAVGRGGQCGLLGGRRRRRSGLRWAWRARWAWFACAGRSGRRFGSVAATGSASEEGGTSRSGVVWTGGGCGVAGLRLIIAGRG